MVNAVRRFFDAAMRKWDKGAALDKATAAANCMNLDEYDSAWQNAVKAEMTRLGYVYVPKGGPAAGEAASWGCVWF